MTGPDGSNSSKQVTGLGEPSPLLNTQHAESLCCCKAKGLQSLGSAVAQDTKRIFLLQI